MILVFKLLVAHVLGDYVFQNQNIAEKKLTDWRYLFLHILIIFSTLYICTLGEHSWALIWALIIIASMHVVDRFKRVKKGFSWFVIDQVFHLLTIAIVPALFGIWHFDLLFNMVNGLFNSPEIWVYTLGYSAGVFGGRVIIGKYMNSLVQDKNGISPLGDKIGIVERLIVITFALFNQYTAIGIVFAIKGVARKVYAENNGELYFLGTGLSFFIAILSALFINWAKALVF